MLSSKVTFAFFSLFLVAESLSTSIKLISLRKCQLPDRNYDKTVRVEYNMTATKIDRKTTIFKGHTQFFEKTGPLFIVFRAYHVTISSKKELLAQSLKKPCTDPLVKTFLIAAKMTLSPDCYAMPGVMTVDGVNLHDFEWLVTRTGLTESGKYLYELEFNTLKGVVICFEAVIELNIK